MKFYLDTSVFGGYYDPEFSEDTMKLFEQIATKQLKIVYSYLTQRELERAPQRVRQLIAKIPNERLEIVNISKEEARLATLYVTEGVLTKKYVTDAQHIAIATIQGVNTLVSWNFRHMVNFFRIQQYNAINLHNGYRTIDIRSPKEVLL